MYQKYFGFTALPFASAPDPKVFYLNPVYQAALGMLRHGIASKKGVMVLTGAVGSGKTALLRKLFDDLGSTVKAIWFVNSKISLASVLRTILGELDSIPETTEPAAMIDALYGALLQNANAGVVICLIIEEAQKLDAETLESLRQLGNFEAKGQKLLQVILVGQPALIKRLDEPENYSLKQRVALHCRLFLLTRSEVERYVTFHLQAAGHPSANLFDSGAIARIAHYSGGVPRLVNTLCDNALLAAYHGSRAAISQELIDEVVSDGGLATDPPADMTAPLGMDWKQAHGSSQGETVMRNATAGVMAAPPPRRAARIVSAALLALIALGGVGWALYSSDGVTFPQFFRSQPQNVNHSIAQSAKTAGSEEVKQTFPPPEALIHDQVADALNAPVIEATEPPPSLPKQDVKRDEVVSSLSSAIRPRSVKGPAMERDLLRIDVQKAIQNRAIEGVSVRLVDGTIYLEGSVASERQRSIAEKAATGVRDGVSVRNQIKVQPVD